MAIPNLIIFTVACTYFGVGFMFLVGFEIATGRIRRNMQDAVDNALTGITEKSATMHNLSGGQIPLLVLSRGMIRALILAVAWIAWPTVLVGFLKSRGEKNAE